MSDERRGAGSKIERPGQDVTVGRKLLRYAHRAAETGDRWFVAMAQGVWRAGSWARAEAETVSDAASAALQTTVTTTRSMMGDGSSKPAGPEGVDGRVARPPDRALEGSEQAPARCQDRHAPGPETAPGTQPSRRRLVGNPASAPRSRGASTRPRLELVQSAPAEEPDLGPETEEAASFAARGGGSISEVSGAPAGVAPLMRALGEVVSDHAEDGFDSLEGDGRVWALIGMLSLVAEAPRAPEEAPSEPPAGPPVEQWQDE